jgi:peptide/nickel transport system permease protein
VAAAAVQEQRLPASFPKRRRRLDIGLTVGVVLLAVIALLAYAAPLVTPHDPTRQILGDRLRPPRWVQGGVPQHVLGTDGFGRDVLSRLLYGGRISIAIGAGAVVLSGVLGTSLGMLAGYKGRWVEGVIMRIADAQQALPPVLLAIIIVAVFGANVANLVLVLAVSSWVIYARVVFAITTALRQREFVEAANAIGASTRRILARHLLPNLWGQVMVISALQAGRMMLLEAALSFLGLGVPEPAPSWGSMLAEARASLLITPWPAAIPGLVIACAVWSVNLIGEGLSQRFGGRA